jgi:exopolysaccharide biosynthesis protein
VRKVFKYGSDQGVGAGGYIIQANGAAASAVAKFRGGEIVQISNSYRTSYKFRYVEAAGRGPRVLEGGKFTWNCATHNKDLRPRSAIGWNQDGQVWLISSSRGFDAIDFGFRQGGSTTSQMGEWLLSLGATDAVLLDGGGSTTMQIKDPQSGWSRFDLPGSAWYRELANAFSIQSKN